MKNLANNIIKTKAILLAASILLLLLFSNTATAQIHRKMSYKTVLRDNSDKLIVNSTVNLKVKIMKGPRTQGTVVYEELHSTNSNRIGEVEIMIGNGNILSGKFSSIRWTEGSYYIKIEIDPYGDNIFRSAIVMNSPF